jgi:hypothetical protein
MAMVEIEHFTPVFTADDERKIGRLAIESRLLQEAVLVWMEETGHRRREDAPMWAESAKAWHRFKKGLNDLLGLEDA